ncbi:MAG: hypothetical protein HY746_10395 [Elusimicrobia bacterium]|nr:hypothetical protein [Elusimicrobiota bacterium]
MLTAAMVFLLLAEAVQVEIESRLGELESHIAYKKRAVYDVDVIQGTLQRFAHFFYKMPVELRIQTMRLLVKQVTVFKDRLRAELHELPVNDLQKVLNIKLKAGNQPILRSPAVCERREQTSKGNTGCHGTPLLELSKMAGTVGAISYHQHMKTLNLKAGKDYLTQSGLSVRVISFNNGNIILQGLASDNLFIVPVTYTLSSFRKAKSDITIRSNPYSKRIKRFEKLGGQPKPLSPIIDALLLEGGRTMRGLVRDVKRRASSACKGKDVKANIRARIYWFKRKGFQVKIQLYRH